MTSYFSKRLEITNKLKQMMINRLKLELDVNEIDNDAPLFGAGLGLDSIDALEIFVGVEQEFSISLKQNQHEIFRSINSIVDYIFSNEKFK